MDFKDFHDGMFSASLLLIIFSITLIYTSIFLKPYIALEPIARDYFITLSILSLLFASLYLYCSFKVKKIFKLELKNIIKFGKELGVINLLFTPHLVFMVSNFLLELHPLFFFMILLNSFIECILIVIAYVEVYDLVFKNEIERKFEIEQNQKYYFKERD